MTFFQAIQYVESAHLRHHEVQHDDRIALVLLDL